MKTNKETSHSLPAFVCAAGLLILLISSCAKAPANNTPVTSIAAMMFIQASPDEPPLDFLLGGQRVNQLPIVYGQNSNYLNINPGTYAASFYADTSSRIFLTDTVHFDASVAYSLFLANKPGHAETVLLKDTLAKPASGSASVRFINLSPDAPAVDLAVKGGAVLVANKAYKQYSSFVPVTANSGTVLEVRQAGTNTVLATLTGVTLNSGFVFTVWFHGLASGTGANDKLSVDAIANAYFL